MLEIVALVLGVPMLLLAGLLALGRFEARFEASASPEGARGGPVLEALEAGDGHDRAALALARQRHSTTSRAA